MTDVKPGTLASKEFRSRKRCTYGMQTTWREDVARIVRRLWAIGETFHLHQLYEHKEFGDLVRRHPGNHTPREKVRQVLQGLRDEGMLEFIDYNGTYKRLR